MSSLIKFLGFGQRKPPMLIPSRHEMEAPNEEWIDAAVEGNKERVEELLEKGADVESKDEYGQTPLYLASRYNSLEVVKLLLEKGAKVDEPEGTGQTPLCASSSCGYDDVVRKLVEHGAGVNQADRKGVTPLIAASKGNHANVIKILIEGGAKINAKDHDGFTALHRAARANKKDVLRTLLENGADINVTDKQGMTALDMAKERNHKDTADILTGSSASTVTSRDSKVADKSQEPPKVSSQQLVESIVGLREEISQTMAHLESLKEDKEKHDAQTKEEIQRLMKEQRELFLSKTCGHDRDIKEILDKIDLLTELVREKPPVTSQTFNVENKNYGEKAGYVFFNSGQLQLAEELESAMGERMVGLTIRLAQIEAEANCKDRAIEGLKRKVGELEERKEERLMEIRDIVTREDAIGGDTVELALIGQLQEDGDMKIAEKDYEIEVLSRKILELNSQGESQKRELAEKYAEVAVLKTRILELETNILELNKDNERELANIARSRDREMDFLQKQILEVEFERKNLAENHERELAVLRNKILESISGKESELIKVADDREDLKRQVLELKSENEAANEMKEQNERLKTEILKGEFVRETMAEKLDNKVRKINDLKEKNAELERNRNVSEQNIRRLETNILEVESRGECDAKKMVEKKERMKVLKRRVAQLEKQASAWKETLDEKESKILDLQENISNLKSEASSGSVFDKLFRKNRPK